MPLDELKRISAFSVVLLHFYIPSCLWGEVCHLDAFDYEREGSESKGEKKVSISTTTTHHFDASYYQEFHYL